MINFIIKINFMRNFFRYYALIFPLFLINCSEDLNPTPSNNNSSTTNNSNGNLSLSSQSYSFSSSGGSYVISITADGNWTASTSQTWISVSPNSGIGNKTVTIYVASNSSTSSRSGTITFTSNNLTQTFLVNQSGSSSSNGGGTTNGPQGTVIIYKPYVQNGTFYRVTIQGISGSYDLSCGKSSVTDCTVSSSCSVAKFTSVPYGTYFVKATGNSGSLIGSVPSWSGNITVGSSCTLVNVEKQLQ